MAPAVAAATPAGKVSQVSTRAIQDPNPLRRDMVGRTSS